MEITYLEWCYHQDKCIQMPKRKRNKREGESVTQYSSDSRGRYIFIRR